MGNPPLLERNPREISWSYKINWNYWLFQSIWKLKRGKIGKTILLVSVCPAFSLPISYQTLLSFIINYSVIPFGKNVKEKMNIYPHSLSLPAQDNLHCSPLTESDMLTPSFILRLYEKHLHCCRNANLASPLRASFHHIVSTKHKHWLMRYQPWRQPLSGSRLPAAYKTASETSYSKVKILFQYSTLNATTIPVHL